MRNGCIRRLDNLEPPSASDSSSKTVTTDLGQTISINLWTYKQIHTPTVVQRGGGRGDWNPSQEFDMLQYFETILPLVESLWSSSQDDVYFMGGGAAGGLWRHQQWSPSWILPRIRNQVKTARNGNFLCFKWKITQISTLHDFSHKIYFYCWKKLKKHVFSPKIGLTTCYL